jgi:hypothetical protein
MILGLTKWTVFFFLSSVDRLVGGGADVERIEFVVLQLVLISGGFIASLKLSRGLIEIVGHRPANYGTQA